jgi:hypothetical protein
MTTCETSRPAPLRCPTLDEIMAGLPAAMPKGRAWQTHEGGPRPGSEIAFAPAGFEAEAFATRYRRPSILQRFWKSIATVLLFVNTRLCDLRFEFWCATHKETHDLWMAEYGLPDECDPFPDLCTKVAAIGGTRCEYYAALAARMGWTIECVEEFFSCGSRTCSRAGKARAGSLQNAAKLKVIVHLLQSPAYHGGRALRSLSGRMRAGRRQSCGPDMSPLLCLMSRIVHAEIQISYEGIND